MDRYDALGEDDLRRLEALTGASLERELDGPLQEIVRQLCAQLGVPISLVSLVLKRTQFFRAHVGLPAELEATLATDRDVSFCQFVVRDCATFEVNDARADARVPQELVRRFGIGAYLGEPVRVGRGVVGSLCAIDVKPRTFTAAERDLLKRLAAQVSHRLEELAATERTAELLHGGTRPAFAELRNLLVPVLGNLSVAQVALRDLSPLVQLKPSSPVLTTAREALADLTQALADASSCADRIRQTVLALEATLTHDRQGSRVDALLDAAAELSHHQTKLVGGVRWAREPGGRRVAVPAAVGGAAVSMALALTADQTRAAELGPVGLDARCALGAEAFEVRISAPGLGPASAAATTGAVARLLASHPFIEVKADAAQVLLSLSLA